MKENAVVLANMGAPENISEIKPFLRNLFSDPDIINIPGGKLTGKLFAWVISRLRYPFALKHYRKIGGGSPLIKLTEGIANEVEKKLNRNSTLIFTAQRYWHPFLSSVAYKLKSAGIKKVLIIPLYPHYSTTTTESILNEWKRCWGRDFLFVDSFYERDEYIKCMVDLIKNELGKPKKNPVVIFTAHSIPVNRVKKGDPYKNQILTSVEKIKKALKFDGNISIGFQSKIGPVKWIGPDILDEVKRFAQRDRSLVIVPLSFVSENVETLFELDITVKEFALNSGFSEYYRVPTVGTHPKFPDLIKNLINEKFS